MNTNLIHLTTNDLFLASIQTPLIRTLSLAVTGVSDFPLPNMLTTKISRLRHISAVFLFSSWNTSYTGAFWSLLTSWNQCSQAAIITHTLWLFPACPGIGSLSFPQGTSDMSITRLSWVSIKTTRPGMRFGPTINYPTWPGESYYTRFMVFAGRLDGSRVVSAADFDFLRYPVCSRTSFFD